jgi:phage-related minor tail protein
MSDTDTDGGRGFFDGLEQGRESAAELERAMQQVGASARGISTALSSGLKQAVVDGRKLDTVFRSIALSLSRRALTAALAPLEKGIASGIGSLTDGLLSGAFGGGGSGGVMPFAKGGVVASPGYFPVGASGTLGLMGEAGAEAILPLARDASGRLGVSAGSGGGGGTGPAIVFNIEARDAESFARSQAQIETMVARAVGRGRRGL